MKKKINSKLNNLDQTHGKLQKYEYKTLDQVLGDDGTSKYKTLDLNKYSEYLNDLNKSDLQSHAIKIGLIPVDSRDILTKRLIKEFTKYVSAYKVPVSEKEQVNINKKAKDILAEGK